MYFAPLLTSAFLGTATCESQRGLGGLAAGHAHKAETVDLTTPSVNFC